MASKEEAAQVAADRIKAAALNAAKGLSRVQAERAAAAAARNVNAYGQKEEGPSRWQERKEAKRQMYLMSTEKAVKLGVRKDLMKSAGPDRGVSASQQCQKCFQTGHWTYECKNERVYMSRPSRSQQLRNPKLKMRVSASCEIENAENEAAQRNGDDRVGVEEKKKKSNKSGGDKKKRKRKYFSGSSDSDSSDSESGSVSESSYSSSTTSTDASDSSTDSERRRRARRHRKGKSSRKRYSSSSSESESSDLDDSSDSDSDSDSYDRSRKSRKSRPSRSSKRHGRS